jgi:hypothetical protein
MHSLHNLYFERNIPLSQKTGASYRRTTTALNVYRGWFEQNSIRFSNRCFFLDYFEEPPGYFKNLTETEAEEYTTESAAFSYNTAINNSFDFRRQKVLNFLDAQLQSLSSAENNICESPMTCSDIINLLYSSISGRLFLPEILELKRISFNKNSKEVSNKAVSLINETRSFLDYLGGYAG